MLLLMCKCVFMSKRVFRPILDEELLKLFKAECALADMSMQKQIEELIRRWLEERGIVIVLPEEQAIATPLPANTLPPGDE